METTKGAENPAPRTQDKDTTFSADTQAVEQSFSVLERVTTNQREPEADRSAVGMLTVKTANAWVEEASRRPDPRPLYKSFWYEGELSCLFSDSNVGKTVLGVQIANEISKSQKILYCDFELSDKQFQLRYTDELSGAKFKFADTLLRAELEPSRFNPDNFEQNIVADIERALELNDCQLVVIDNITYLGCSTEKGEAAGRLMILLNNLKKRKGLSILALAHTPKRSLTNPITQNDLAGSKRLFNFFDSVFGLGQSAVNKSVKYVKQIKVRHGAFEYGADNVLVCELFKENSFLMMREIGCAEERAHLREWSDQERDNVKENVMTLSQRGLTQRAIASQLSISVGMVNKILKQRP